VGPENKKNGTKSPIALENEIINVRCTVCEGDLLDEISSKLDRFFPDIITSDESLTDWTPFKSGREDDKKNPEHRSQARHHSGNSLKPVEIMDSDEDRSSKAKKSSRRALVICSTIILLTTAFTWYLYYRPSNAESLTTPKPAGKFSLLSETLVQRQLVALGNTAEDEILTHSGVESSGVESSVERMDEIAKTPGNNPSNPTLPEEQIDTTDLEQTFSNPPESSLQENRTNNSEPETSLSMIPESSIQEDQTNNIESKPSLSMTLDSSFQEEPIKHSVPDTGDGPEVLPNDETEKEITEFLAHWKEAWELTAGKDGDMAAYISFYSEAFSGKGFDKKGWETDKTAKNKRKAWIKVELSDIRISDPPVDNKVVVHFSQIFRSSNFSDRSIQSLVLKKENNGWKIVGIQKT